MSQERTTNRDEATVTLDTSFGPDYITVEQTRNMDGIRAVTITLDVTTDPVDGFDVLSVAFHGRRRGQGINELITLRNALNRGIAYLGECP